MRAYDSRDVARAAVTAALVIASVAAPLCLPAAPQNGSASPAAMVRIPAGTYLPLYREPSPTLPTTPGVAEIVAKPPASVPAPATRRRVAAFEMDVTQVTNAQYLDFVRDHPQWRRSKVKRLLAEATYLAHWQGDLELGSLAPPDSPVVNVSWFAARAYLRAQGKELPTVDQWEYVAAASEQARDASRDPTFIDRLRAWYGLPVPQRLPAVSTGFKNVYGIQGVHGLVWEWTLDFNSALVTGESRADGSLERTLYCGAGATGATDFDNYPAFMRYALRSSLQARYSVGSLGFRGVRSLTGATP